MKHDQLKSRWTIENRRVRRETQYIILDYRELKRKIINFSYYSMPASDHDKLVEKVAKVKLRAIEETIAALNEKYEDTCTGEPFNAYGAYESYEVYCYYRSRPYKDEAPSERTWAYYRAEFVWNVAYRLGLV